MRSRREKEKKIELRHGEECRDLRLGRFREKKENKFLTFFFFLYVVLTNTTIYIYIYSLRTWKIKKNEN